MRAKNTKYNLRERKTMRAKIQNIKYNLKARNI